MDPTNPVAGPSSRDDDEGAPPAKRVRITRFQDSWLDIPELAGWLQAVQDEPTKAFCTCCQKKLSCGKSKLLKHATAKTHLRSRALAVFDNEALAAEQRAADARVRDIQDAEIRIAAMVAVYDIPLEALDDMVELFRDIFSNPRVAEGVMKLFRRTEPAPLITNSVATRENLTLVDILKTQKFSVLVDESTDIAGTKTLCVLVQFVSPDTKLVAIEPLESIELNAVDYSGDKVYSAFKSCLENKGVPISNVVGMASDNASVPSGIHHSFMTHLQKDSPRLITINCICDSPALIASKACSMLPHACEDLIQRVGSYVSGSAERNAILCEFQELLDREKSIARKLSETRWLSKEDCVSRLLQNWDALKTYFEFAAKQDNLESAEIILAYLSDDVNKAYLFFVAYALRFFNHFNTLFRSSKVFIHELAQSSRSFVTAIGSHFLRPELLPELTSGTFNVSHPRNILPLDEVFPGPECNKLLSTLPAVESELVRQNCLRFYIAAVEEIQKRLPLEPSIFDDFRFLDPQIALFLQNRENFPDLTPVVKHFGGFNASQLSLEWRSLPHVVQEEKKNELLKLDVDAFWKEVACIQSFSHEQRFPGLEQLVNVVLSLPHWNSEAERLFSTVIPISKIKSEVN